MMQDYFHIHNDLEADIKDLLKEHGLPCITIIVPTHPNGIKFEQDKKELLRAIISAIHATKDIKNFRQSEILNSLSELFRKVDFKKNKMGIGLFVSPGVKKLVSFPFPVRKKILVNEAFDLCDLIYTENYSIKYHLLDISKNEFHLFQGRLDHLEEIHDENFPIKFDDDFEYSKPNQSSSNAGYAHTKGFEKDKSIVQKIRTKQQLQKAEKLLTKYISSKKVPFVICGLNENISIFKSLTHHLNDVIFSMGDNYRHTGLRDLEVIAWTSLKTFIDGRKLDVLNEFKEKAGTNLAEYGIHNVWRAAKSGRGYKLMVERDFEMSAFVSDSELLFAQQPSGMHGRTTDLVVEILTTVLEKNGRVLVVENDMLKEFERIAMINRY
jgi:hypothetical protein